ncbi:MAG: glycosyltransferase family 4 protein, partial [Candidatus Pacebacteria bacterium]|nr:glycosyltransferase family 4 protein [Candidatus Paceibacterota bacterium]
NVMDFNNPPPNPDDYTRNFRKDIGLEDGELLVLQPTRVVKRKRIELAINLIHHLERKASLVITHSSNDEGTKYAEWLNYFSERLGIRTIFVADIIGTSRGINSEGKRIYTLADIYDQADIVTFPSGNEGFGNAFLEAVYYKKPLVVNNYATYHTDIKPKGFKTIEIDGFVNQDTIDHVKNILNDKQTRNDMAQHNYNLAQKYFSYDVLNKKLQYLIEDFFD